LSNSLSQKHDLCIYFFLKNASNVTCIITRKFSLNLNLYESILEPEKEANFLL